MSGIEYEPYLEDWNCSFHGIFTLFDSSLNSSEIKPVHLALPRNRTQKKNSTSPAQSGPRVMNVGEKVKPGEKEQPKRFLSSRYTNSRQQGATRMLSSTATPATAAPTNAVESPQQSPPNSKASLSSTSTEKPRGSEPMAHKPSLSHADNSVVTEMLLKVENYWMMPLNPNLVVRFLFTIQENRSTGSTFSLLLETTKNPILIAKMTSPQRTSPLQIFFEDKLVGETRYNSTSNSFYCGLTALRPASEACAVIFNPQFNSNSTPRIFDFLVPALKKIEGKSRMFPIQYNDTSGLVARLSQMSKECIRMKTRTPVSKDNDYDMTFEGKFPNANILNFAIYHDSNIRKNLCTMGMKEEGVFELEIGYPMSPIQGFIAAVAASLPYN